MKARLIVAATATAAAVVAGGIVLSGPASAVETTLCDQYASTEVQGGDYIVQNNRWGTDATQCIEVTDDGFTVTQQDGVASTSGAPTAYPSIYWGCHYATCTNDFSPIQANTDEFAGISTGVSMSYPSDGDWDAAYDIWFDPTARTDGQNTGAEVMIWANHSGAPQPVGSKVGTVTVADGTWDVWYGNSGWNVISYVRTEAADSVDFALSDFYDDAVQRGYAQDTWYLTSVQAGFEPWNGGVGLAASGFSVTEGEAADDGGSTAEPTVTIDPVTPTATASPSDSATTDPGTTDPGEDGSCTADYEVTQSWNGGFLGQVTVENTGDSDTANWTVDWEWPADQELVSSWNAGSTQTGAAVSASSLSYNSVISSGAGTQFGMQVAGDSAAPELTCSAS